MIRSIIFKSLKVCREYLNGNDSHVEVVDVPLSVNKAELVSKTISDKEVTNT